MLIMQLDQTGAHSRATLLNSLVVQPLVRTESFGDGVERARAQTVSLGLAIGGQFEHVMRGADLKARELKFSICSPGKREEAERRIGLPADPASSPKPSAHSRHGRSYFYQASQCRTEGPRTECPGEDLVSTPFRGRDGGVQSRTWWWCCSGDGETLTKGEKWSLEATRTAISTSTENGDQPRSDAYIYTYLNE